MEMGIKKKLQQLSRRLKKIKAADIMNRKVVTTRPEARLSAVAEMMLKKGIRAMPVLEARKKMVGIVTSTDLFMLVDMIKSGDVVGKKGEVRFDPSVRFAMSSDFVKIEKNTDLEKIMSLVKCKNIHSLPVFDRGKLLGIVERRDMLKSFYQAVKDL